MRFPIIVFFVFLLPVAEIVIFILVGQKIGLLSTLGLVLLAAFAGSILLRNHGPSAFRRVLLAINKGKSPQKPLIDGLMIMLAGILLFLPGFITDLMALMVLASPVRYWLWQLAGQKIMSFRPQDRRYWQGKDGGSRQDYPDVVDLDAEEFQRSDPASHKRLDDRA